MQQFYVQTCGGAPGPCNKRRVAEYIIGTCPLYVPRCLRACCRTARYLLAWDARRHVPVGRSCSACERYVTFRASALISSGMEREGRRDAKEKTPTVRVVWRKNDGGSKRSPYSFQFLGLHVEYPSCQLCTLQNY